MATWFKRRRRLFIGLTLIVVLLGGAFWRSPETTMTTLNTLGYAVAAIVLACIAIAMTAAASGRKSRRDRRAPAPGALPGEAETPASGGSEPKKAKRRNTRGVPWISGLILLLIAYWVFIYMGLWRPIWEGIYIAWNGHASPELHANLAGGNAVRMPSARERFRVEATRLTAPEVPVGSTRSLRYQVPDGYEVRTQPGQDFVNVYCSNGESGPEGRLSTSGNRCVGGWVSFSLISRPEYPAGYTEPVQYTFRWVGS